ncbi:oligosaccharyl transferase subunit ost3/OST6 [Diatrype stigma]|uniref:Oligosaccharyl transferase subunit ost3/OST6 n=1 Tax=Diatrype stigma TaxID=117547 RepID=A0AAN9UU19_9PEZI
MRWLSLLFSAALPLTALAAAKKPVFDDFHAKAVASAPVKLSDSSYKKLTAVPRDHSVAVVLTALDQRYQCGLCHEFQPEWELLARSWTKGDKKAESRVIFSTLDFADGRDTFMSPTTGPHAVPDLEPLRYDFTNGQISAEQIHAWIARHLPDRPHPPVKRPVNWLKWTVVTVTVLTTVGVIAKAWHLILPVIQSRFLWAVGTLFLILAFTSGYMFNSIRKTPYVAANGQGSISYFAPGFQNQLGIETQIIGFLYGLLAVATTTLTIRVPRERDPKKQRVMIVAWGGVLYLTYSFLLYVFRFKNGGYPFKLPPFF